MTANTSAIYVSRSFGYEKINELRLDNQAFIFDFEHHFKTTSENKSIEACIHVVLQGLESNEHIESENDKIQIRLTIVAKLVCNLMIGF